MRPYARPLHTLACLSILLGAAALRLAYPAWDGLLGAHPDERTIVMAAGDLRGLDPYRTGDPNAPRTFPYGHVPLYLLAGMGALVTGDGDPYTRLLLAGRALSALADTLTVALTYALARRITGPRAALWAAAAYALALLPVQLAHFYAVDTLLTTLITASLLCALWRAQGGSRAFAWLGAALAGLAVGTKLPAGLLLAPWALVAGMRRELRAGALLAGAAAAYALTNPFALIDLPISLQALLNESGIASGALDAPYTRQYAGTWAYAYQGEQMLRWALGPALGVLALAGLAYALYLALRRQAAPALLVLLAWTLPYLLITGAAYARFARYLLPALPALCALAALLLTGLAQPARAAAVALGLLALLWSAAHSLALVNMYAEPHPWVSASVWTYEHVPPGAALAVETWDDALPVPLTLNGQVRDSSVYRFVTLDPFEPDSPAKLAALAQGLASSDYVVLASRRLYGTIPRLAQQGDARYFATACYYRRLFAGELGFARVYAITRVPRLGPLSILDGGTAGQGGLALDLGSVDETYNVYDHPQVYVFANVERWSAQRLRAAIAACPQAALPAPGARVSIPGGHSPAGLFSLLAQGCRERALRPPYSLGKPNYAIIPSSGEPWVIVRDGCWAS